MVERLGNRLQPGITQVRLLLPPQKGTAVKIAVPEQTTGGQLWVVQNRG